MSEIKDKFDNLQVIQVPTYNKKYSVKTNLLNIFKFIRVINERTQIIINYIKELANSIDVPNIVKLVLQNLNENKLSFQLDYQQVIDNSLVIIKNDILFKVTRINQYSFTIEKDTDNWQVQNIGAFGKTLNGDMIYPKINTSNNKVTVIFSEPPSENINIYII